MGAHDGEFGSGILSGGHPMLAIIAALLFLIAFIIELIYYNGADTLLITAGFLLVALYLGGVGPRTVRRFW